MATVATWHFNNTFSMRINYSSIQTGLYATGTIYTVLTQIITVLILVTNSLTITAIAKTPRLQTVTNQFVIS